MVQCPVFPRGGRTSPDQTLTPRADHAASVAAVQTTTTDSLGSFRFPVKTAGKCLLTVAYGKQTPAVEIVAFDKPARYRLLVELKDGKYTVKRV